MRVITRIANKFEEPIRSKALELDDTVGESINVNGNDIERHSALQHIGDAEGVLYSNTR